MSLPSRPTRPDGSEHAALDEAVRRLVEALHPERIYLFGSHARGNWTADSDYDFLVVVPSSDQPRHDQVVAAQRALRGLGISKDVVVESSAAFARRASVASSLAATVLREGRLLYGEPWLPDGGAWDVDEKQERTALTRQWQAKASRDLKMAELGLEAVPPIPDLVVFHCQQAAEKALKGFLAWHSRPLRRTHDLERLLAECEGIDPDFAPLRPAADELADYAVDLRYPTMMPEPTEETTRAARAAAEHIVEFVFARLPPAARPGRSSTCPADRPGRSRGVARVNVATRLDAAAQSLRMPASRARGRKALYSSSTYFRTSLPGM